MPPVHAQAAAVAAAPPHPISTPVKFGANHANALATGFASSVLVPAVRGPPKRISLIKLVPKLVRIFWLLPVSVTAVPPESDTVKLRAITASRSAAPEVDVDAAVVATLMRIRMMTIR